MKKIVVILISIMLVLGLSCCNTNRDNEHANAFDVQAYGYNEMIDVSVKEKESAEYSFYYKKSGDSTFITVDSSLIYQDLENKRCEIVGLKSGEYDVKVTETLNGETKESIVKNIEVSALDRSGYAHFNNQSGVGAYNDDGTLKANAYIIYLNNENKNTVTATFSGTQYKGIYNILSNLYFATTPVVIRVMGRVSTNQWRYKAVIPRLTDNSNLDSTHFENEFSTEYGENIENIQQKLIDKKDGKVYRFRTTKTGVVKITDQTTSTGTIIYNRSRHPELMGKEVYHDDSNFNMVPVKRAKNITIEGVTKDAELFQWGISFSNCDSVEIRNLTFTDNPEDAIGISSNELSVDAHGRFWVHHNRFNAGKNFWDLTGEQDKYAGDGAVDINQVNSVTVSYNEFIGCNKTGLVSSSDEQKCKNITFHHNYYKDISSRLPLARGANIHIYNNYYDNCSSCLNIRVNAFVLSENNYFNNSKKCHQVTNSAIKSFGDVFYNSTGVQSTIVSNREQIVQNSCAFDGIDYSSFDTDENLFYYDAQNKKSAVLVMNEADKVQAFNAKYSGAKGKYEKLPIA